MNCVSGLKALILSLLVCAAALAQNPTASVTVDVNASRRPIDPRVYGIAYGTTAQLADLNVPLNRYGGNNTSRYNWQLNADNRGQDWYFESIPESSSTPGERDYAAGGLDLQRLDGRLHRARAEHHVAGATARNAQHPAGASRLGDSYFRCRAAHGQLQLGRIERPRRFH